MRAPARRLTLCLVFALAAAGMLACNDGPSRQRDTSYQPAISPSAFTNSTNITNPYLPFPAGVVYIFEGETDEGLERVEIRLLPGTRKVMGIDCVIVNDKAWLDGVLIEDTDDWFAQDNSGTVWYFGEDVDNYSKGKLTDHDGSWEAGVDGALPGIVMQARPVVGAAYRQEYYFGEAEDAAEVVEVGLTITTPFGTFKDVIKVKETTALEPDVLEFKFYAPNVGLIKVINETDDEEMNLIEIRRQ